MAEEGELRRELDEARATIAAQAVQLHRLESGAQAGGALPALAEILQLGDVVGATVGEAPFRNLLVGIVEAARRIFGAGAASILLLDRETDELVFEAATEGGGDVMGMRFPSHQGIAGWVVMTGEPIAVSDVRRDPRWARDFAQATGYVPRSIMAVPLLVGEEVEGVLEVLDKAAGASFGLDDMELLGLFARPAAIAVEQTRLVTGVARLLVEELGALARTHGRPDLAQDIQRALSQDSSSAEVALELARLVHRLSRHGERAQMMALEILSSVLRNV